MAGSIGKSWIAFVLAAAAQIGTASAAELTQRSKAPDWAAASLAEKEQWLLFLKPTTPDVDPKALATCLDDYSLRPAFETNGLTEISSLCTAAARTGDQ